MQSPSTPSCMLDDFRCRLCFTSSDIDLQPLFPPGEDCFVNDLLSRIYDCLAIHVSFLEDFCAVICSACRDKINTFYLFKKQCQSNDGYLREKRSRLMNGAELESKSRVMNNHDQPSDDVSSASQCKVEEPQEEEMLLQTKHIFGHDQNAESTSIPEATLDINHSKGNVAVQISNTSSGEFLGYPNEVIKKPDTENDETLSETPVPVEDNIQECRVPLEKLNVKSCVEEQRPNAKNGHCTTPKPKKQVKTEQTSQRKPLSLRKKAVLYFDGYEYRKPRPCHNGTVQWECCKISCSATLQQKPDGKLKLNHKHQPHPQQVVNDGLILDRKLRKRVPFLLTSNNHKKKFIYNDSFRYLFSEKLPNDQVIWTCEAQTEGCKAYVKITNDFRSVLKVFQHNHSAEMIVRRRN